MILYKRGSRGEMVKRIQNVLHLYPDGIFGVLTEQAIKDFQKENGLKVDGIVGLATLAKLGLSNLQEKPANTDLISTEACGLTLKKSKRTIKEIIVHCTATPPYMDVTTVDIRKWHRQQGWSDIGYHYVVYLDGSLHVGRDVDIQGAHCADGGHNRNSIGIVYVGGVAEDKKTPEDTRNEYQKKTLLETLKALKKLYPDAKIYGHRDFSRKACPSFDARKEYQNL